MEKVQNVGTKIAFMPSMFLAKVIYSQDFLNWELVGWRCYEFYI